jgi:hypothetical protein
MKKRRGLVLGQLTGNKGPAPGVVDCRRQDDRRQRIVTGLIYGNFRPRRRKGRRVEDHHSSIFDWHQSSVLYLGLAVLLLSCTDALFTLNLMKLGATEANAVMDSTLRNGVDSFLAVKISLTAISVILLVAVAQRRVFGLFRVVRLLQLTCAGYVALIAYEFWLFGVVFGFGLSEAFPMLASVG